MHFELKERAFYKKTARLMAPVILQQLITAGINFLDNVMIGGFGEIQIAAVSFSNLFYSLFQFICMGLGSGAVVLASQFWGRKELDPMRIVASIALRLTVVLCGLFTVLAVGFPQVALHLFTNVDTVVAVGIPYMRLVGTTFIMAGLASTATYLLRSAGEVRIPLIGSAVSFFLNLFFNWVFIFGKLGAPRMELLGAAVGTVIARAFELCFIFGYFVFKDDRFTFRLKHFALSGKSLQRQYFRYGIPVLISDTSLGISLSLIHSIMGHVGEEISAAGAMINSEIQMISVLTMGMGGAAAIVVGNTIGEGDLARAKREANTYMLFSFIIGALLIIPLLLLEPLYLSLYDVSEQTKTIAHGMLLCNCLWLPIQINAYVTSKGILRGGGDTRFLLFADSSTVWLLSLPLGYLSAFVWELNPILIYLFLRLEYPSKGVVCLIRYLSGKWIKEIKAKE